MTYPEDSSIPNAPGQRAGMLLVASPELIEPSFRRTVVYVIEDNDSGSLGVVLNRPSDTAVHNLLPQWSPVAALPPAMFVGGPVKRDAALCLGVLKAGVNPEEVQGIRLVHESIVMIDLDSEAEKLAKSIEGVRIFAGYSGWTMGQLEGEISRGDWMVVPGLAADVLAPPRYDLWAQVLRRQPLPMAMLATHPIDLLRN
ncbi:MAG: YqgE/AlgH family protein [Mycobacteriaceae bacterium]